jgi:hypothetical protein
MSCPKCGRVFSEKGLVKILRDTGVPKEVVKKVKEEIAKKQVANEL